MNPWLVPEPLVQSDDPEIVATAKAIVGEERDVLRAARRIHEWVFENVRKRNSAGVPSAVEVLRTKSGDCNEHTVLYVALARAAGIPTRLAVGLVWANARGAGPGLYYHAWARGVRRGERHRRVHHSGNVGWLVRARPHARPGAGGHRAPALPRRRLERQVDLLKLIGKLEVEVLPFETPFAPVIEDTAGNLEATNHTTSTSGEGAP